MKTDQIKLSRAAGMVRRFHCMELLQPENVAQHTFNVMNLLMIMSDGRVSRNLLVYALLHDQGEWKTGDIPSPTKRLLGTEAKLKLDLLEEEAIREIHPDGSPILSGWEQHMFKLADNLDGLIKIIAELNQRGNKPTMLVATGREYIKYLRAMTGGHDGTSTEVVAHFINVFERKWS